VIIYIIHIAGNGRLGYAGDYNIIGRSMEEKHKLKIKDKEVELTKSEAKRLYNELAILFGEQKLIKKIYYPANYEARMRTGTRRNEAVG